MIRSDLPTPDLDPEVQEALSHKHSHGRWTVPLDSGRIAVFNHPQGALRCICDTWEEALSVHVPQYAEAPPTSVSKAELDALDLDLDL